MAVLMVSSHKGAIAWLARQKIDAKMIEHLDISQVQAGDHVIGTLPVHMVAQLCAAGARYSHIAMEVPQNRRRQELSADDMETFSARLEEYVVTRVIAETDA